MTTDTPTASAGSTTSDNRPGTRQLAVVTGASTGIGLELAKQLASNGFDLVLAADESLADAESTLAPYGADVRSVVVDLSTAEGTDELASTITGVGRPVDALLLNAGIGESGPFVTTDLEHDLRLINLNVISVVRLAKRLVPGMVERGSGRILVTSSVASIAPAPNQALYGASKSFLQSFAEALRQELVGTGVTVTSLMPGPTDTSFFSRAGLEHTALGSMKKDDASTVAQQGLEAMLSGREKVVAGSALTRMQGQLAKAMPDRVKAAMQGLLSAPGTAAKLPGFLKK
jgi:short-subunit dehydrogenase